MCVCARPSMIITFSTSGGTRTSRSTRRRSSGAEREPAERLPPSPPPPPAPRAAICCAKRDERYRQAPGVSCGPSELVCDAKRPKQRRALWRSSWHGREHAGPRTPRTRAHTPPAIHRAGTCSWHAIAWCFNWCLPSSETRPWELRRYGAWVMGCRMPHKDHHPIYIPIAAGRTVASSRGI